MREPDVQTNGKTCNRSYQNDQVVSITVR